MTSAVAELSAQGSAQHRSTRARLIAAGTLSADRGLLKLVGVPDYRFPVVARILAATLIGAHIVAAGRVGTDTPADLQNQLPFIRIGRVGGSSDLLNDYADTDIEVFAATSVDSERLSEYVRQHLVFDDLPAIDGYGLIDRVECTIGPQEAPWADARIRRYVTTYRVISRRRRVS